MNIRQIQYVFEVARQGCNISAAAKALHTAQSGVSKQLKLFEDELGLPLFHKKGNRLVGLTSAGAIVLDSARVIVNELARVKNVGLIAKKATVGN